MHINRKLTTSCKSKSILKCINNSQKKSNKKTFKKSLYFLVHKSVYSLSDFFKYGRIKTAVWVFFGVVSSFLSTSKFKMADTEKQGKKKTKEIKPGIVYLSTLPPFMKPFKVRNIFSQYGEVGRLFLQPEGLKMALNVKSSYWFVKFVSTSFMFCR